MCEAVAVSQWLQSVQAFDVFTRVSIQPRREWYFKYHAALSDCRAIQIFRCRLLLDSVPSALSCNAMGRASYCVYNCDLGVVRAIPPPALRRLLRSRFIGGSGSITIGHLSLNFGNPGRLSLGHPHPTKRVLPRW